MKKFCFKKIWVRINHNAKHLCPSLCEKLEYHIRTPTSGQNYAEFANKTSLWILYASPKVRMEEEYVLMGGNALISATGGSLGLFLGLSFYGVIWKIIEIIQTTFIFPLSSWRKKGAKAKICNEDFIC